MNIQGSRERILDSVLPHEVTHTIFASYFRQPLPRWADEGACTTMEHRSEISKQERNLIMFLKTGRGIPFSQMFAMKEYPSDVMPLYAQGHSVSEWLIESRGRKEFLGFLGDGMKDENWPRAVHDHYGFNNLAALQNSWNDWVRAGRPQLTPATSPVGQLAANSRNVNGAVSIPATPGVLRLQSPDSAKPATATVAASVPKQSPVSTAITVAAPGTSVYAVAARAETDGEHQLCPIVTTAASGASVYDASRGGSTMLR